MHSFIMSVIGGLLKLLWIFSSASKNKNDTTTYSKTDVSEDRSVNNTPVHFDEKTAEVIQEASKLDSFLTNIQETNSPEERLNLLIEFEEDEKMRELLIKIRGH